MDSKVSSRIDRMHKKDTKKERNRGEKELLVATKLVQKETNLSRKNLKKALHLI